MNSTWRDPAGATYLAVSFDCYGTLVDWERGLDVALRAEAPGLDDAALRALIDARGRAEWKLIEELTEFRPYRALLAESVAAAAASLGLPLDGRAAERVAASIGGWPPYPDAQRALERLAKRFRLAIVSNVDRADLLATLERLGRPDVHVVTAEDVQCYKPEPDHLLALIHELGIDEHELLHVSAYAEYDLATAQDLGIPGAYVDRRGEPLPEEVEAAMTVNDLDELARRLLARRGRRP